MSATFTIRIPRELKERMEKSPIQWDDEIRNFIEVRVNQVGLIKTIEEIDARAAKRKTKVDSTKLIREGRERQS